MTNATLVKIQRLIASGHIRISEHGYDELINDGLTAREVISGVENAILVEDYPTFHKGPTVLVLQFDHDHNPIHVVWGIPKGKNRPVVLVTAYRPDPERWNESFTERRR